MTSYQSNLSGAISFPSPPSVISFASTVGKKEGEGPYGKYFDTVVPDPYFGQKTWESAESALFESTVAAAIAKAALSPDSVTALASGDLLNQCTASGYAARNLGMPHLGLYGACSTMAESLIVASLVISAGASYAVAATSSHFCGSEKQFRFPLEYGSLRTPTSQWTVTGSGAVVLGSHADPPFITRATMGRVVDAGITDANNMGAAMAPAFCDTLSNHLAAFSASPSDYDMIYSGDLGHLGKKIAVDLLKEHYNINIEKNYNDCGCMIYAPSARDVRSGGSGCGCSASMLAAHILPSMKSRLLKRVLFIATGALMSPTLTLQGESIPAVAHAVEFSLTV